MEFFLGGDIMFESRLGYRLFSLDEFVFFASLSGLTVSVRWAPCTPTGRYTGGNRSPVSALLKNKTLRAFIFHFMTLLVFSTVAPCDEMVNG
jgi:hypothetical protein